MIKKLSALSRWLPGIILISAFALLYRSSMVSMVHTWAESKTYTHGYLIFPLSAYLIWRLREPLQLINHRPVTWFSVVLAGLGIGWVVTHLLSVQVLEQTLFIVMLHAMVFALYGPAVYKIIIFPLFFLFFAVPMGEVFVPYLMRFTADFTVAALSFSGIPVYREGMYFSIPAGDFEVARACSGIRYLMASFSLGTLYAYMSFRTFKKQVFFSLACLLVPVLANAVRAYGIVLIAHLTEMEHAVGLDHLLYGWLFFGLVMFALFYVGGWFRSAEDFEPISVKATEGDANYNRSPLVILIAVSLALIIPQLIYSQTMRTADLDISAPLLPTAVAGWSGPHSKAAKFEPEFTGETAKMEGAYQLQDQNLKIWMYRYQPFSQQREMVNGINQLVTQTKWKALDQRAVKIENVDGLKSVNEARVRYADQDYLVWYWYQVGNRSESSRIYAKLQEGWSWITGGFGINEAIVVLAVEYNPDAPRVALQRFAETHFAALRHCVFSTGTDAQCVSGFQVHE